VLRALHAALAYFTILPLGSGDAPDARALAWLPFVGALTGALAGSASYAVALVAPHPLAVATAFGAAIVLTGAIHLDGFLDGCDAFFASTTPERRLEILKDPRHGTFALAGLAIFAVVWLAAFGALRPAAYVPALAFAGAASRWAAVIHAAFVPDVRAAAPNRALAAPPPWPLLVAGFVLTAVLALPLRMQGAFAFAVALLLANACVAWTRARLGGGLVGDAYGFAIVVAETGALVALSGAM
jgi:adenosylcobinamide-GDP ribazoletransferase